MKGVYVERFLFIVIVWPFRENDGFYTIKGYLTNLVNVLEPFIFVLIMREYITKNIAKGTIIFVLHISEYG